MLIQLVGCTRHSDNGGTLSTDIRGAGHLSKVISKKFKKLIQTVLIELVSCNLHSDNYLTLSSDNGDTGHLSKVTSSKIKNSFKQS